MTQPAPVNILQVQRFLSTPENPVSTSEFKQFWGTLTDEEKDQFKREVAEATN